MWYRMVNDSLVSMKSCRYCPLGTLARSYPDDFYAYVFARACAHAPSHTNTHTITISNELATCALLSSSNEWSAPRAPDGSEKSGNPPYLLDAESAAPGFLQGG
jgi:hypothetical protein